ncbi:MAG TPA: ABC transporter ATP-binding protein [Candidatus Marinimicrobia bacterium]|jgi:ABC-type multidrug transport system ATPase subunit|nr:ABC transporter ATP-binding protein [Candidatus Neomarinimicrobiota bacterium]HIN01845.1 ABC transporter ATP-binding protein [Candidatus Neomarinimicrobiota bacterium]
MEASITLKKVGKLIGDKTILAGLTFGVERGTLVAIVGVNDAGKSTLIKLLSGFENPNYGQVFIHGLDMEKRRRETRELIGYVPHENDLDPWLTVEQNIRFTANLYKVNTATASARIVRFAEALNLVPYLNEIAMNVSHGIQKKTMLVRELVHDPDVLIMDEPTGYMDAESIRLTWDLLKELKGNKTIIYVSNALAEIEQAHDRILVFHEGRILMDGHLDKLLESTMDYHQFQIEFKNLSAKLYKQLANVATVVSPNRLDNIFHFYGRTRNVFFDVIRTASDELMIDLNVKKLGLRDLLDSEFAGRGLD